MYDDVQREKKKGIEIEKRKLIIGEGVEEIRFFNSFLRHLEINDIQVLQCGGKDRIKEYLDAIKILPPFKDVTCLGIIRDADSCAESAFKSVCTALAKAGLPHPEKINDFSEGSPRVGVFVMPDGKNPGMLETLCLESVKGDSAMCCVDEYMNCIKESSHSPNNIHKAKVHTWLASRKRPDLRLGEAAEHGHWQFDDKSFDNLRDFILKIQDIKE